MTTHQKEIQTIVKTADWQRSKMQIALNQTICVQRGFVFSIRPELVEIDGVGFECVEPDNASVQCVVSGIDHAGPGGLSSEGAFVQSHEYRASFVFYELRNL